MCNEFSQLKTGYAVYGHEVLTRLHNTDKYEIFEQACYAHHNDPRTQSVPWNLYSNLPDQNNQEQVNQYNSNPTNQFGEWRFEDICIDCKPHIVMDIRDYWMMSHEFRSPFRPCFNHVIMPTVDAYPQNEEWISSYASADGVFTFQDWSKEVLDHESAGKIKTLGAASPAADPAFQPMNGESIKKSVGLENYKIIGTVMRNQRRKLFPDLFGAFKVFLETSKRTDILLYCHTSYPDMGWDLPKLLLQYGLGSKVLFTYVCRECGHAHPNFFNDALMSCPRCKKMTSAVSNVQSGVDNQVLAAIMNMFDLYVQWANSEGFGMPVLEAAACGVPVIAVDYSAMSDSMRKLGGLAIKPIALSMELETGCFRAVPNNDILIDKFHMFFNKLTEEQRQTLRAETRQKYLENYSWDATAQKWGDCFDRVNTEYYEQMWNSPPRYTNIPTDFPRGLSNPQFAKWLIFNVLGEPRYINSYMESRLIRDLNYEVTNMGIAGMYFNDQSALFSKPNWQSFNQETAFKHFVELGNRKNFWENKRWAAIQSAGK
jgi:glycosyltransferase involved in cell wall biosynthesis